MSPPTGQPPTLTLAVLATRIAEVAGKFEELQGRLDTNEQQVASHGETLTETACLAAEVSRLSRLVTGQAAGSDTAAEGVDERVHPRNWAKLAGEARVKELRELARWVTEILLVTYPHVAPELPPCWPAHPAVVAELDWLYWTWEDVWAAPAPRPRDAADWHDRWLPGVRSRIKPLVGPCLGSEVHLEPGDQRPIHAEYRPPAGDAGVGYWPELEFIERLPGGSAAETSQAVVSLR